MPLLASSAVATAKQSCSGANRRICGLSWLNGSAWDGTQGAGQQMAALEVILGNLMGGLQAPLTNATGGTSVGNPGAGVSRSNPGTPPVSVMIIDAGDRIGAGVLTVILLAFLMACFAWISSDLLEDGTVQKLLQDCMLGFLISYLIIE